MPCQQQYITEFLAMYASSVIFIVPYHSCHYVVSFTVCDLTRLKYILLWITFSS